MKKNRLLLLLNVSVITLTPTVHAQEVTEEIQKVDEAQDQSVPDEPIEQTGNEQSALTETKSEDGQTAVDAQEQENLASNESLTDSAETQEADVAESAPSVVSLTAETESKEEEPTAQGQERAQSTESTEIVSPETSQEYGPQESSHEEPAAPEPVSETVVPQPEPKPEPKPEVVAPEPVVEQKPQPVESLLDTIDIEEGGNWVLKRKALQDTVRKVEDINSLYDDIRDTNVVFLQGINTVDVLFSQFTYDVGLDLGKVDQLVQDVAHHLESEREQDGDLTEAERELLTKAEERKKEIEQLRANIQDIWQANAQLKEARALNDEQIIEADRLRKQAWANFRMIERVLNEVKAEQLYYETVQLFEALQTSHRYLQTRLIPHFEQSIKTIQAKMQAVKQQSEELQKEGVLLKQEAVQLDREQKSESQQEVHVPAAQTRGWLSTLKNIVMAPFNALGSLWGWITGSSEDMSKYLPDDVQAAQNEHPEEL